MPAVTAQDVKKLREGTGAGILDAKRALVENDGDFDKAATWLRERGLGKMAERGDRDNSEGAIGVALTPDGTSAALVELKCETDFVAKSPQFVALVNELARSVAAEGESAADAKKAAIEDLVVTLKENIALGKVVRFAAASGNLLSTYVHIQNERGVNGILVELEGGNAELAHDVAVHIAFARPGYLSREEVPDEAVAAERVLIEAETRNEGKPEAALPKIVEGKLNGWYKRVPGGVLVDQPFAKDDKQSVAQYLGSARVVRFAQAEIGA
ncbi:MAG: translation elongation factor Ts [Acidimicrobiaceae bacterium]|nr:translation elongation factor Ts [Acidimicrobiaceae bacterium]